MTVHKLAIECLVPATASYAQSATARLKDIARTSLQEALADCLEPLQGGGDEVVLIKKLDLDLDLDLLLSEQQTARLWAAGIKKALLKAMGADHAGMVLFASPAHYLSSFLLDVLHGRARQLWYYRQFDGLWALPLGAGLRTALLDDPERGLAALSHLHSRELVELCGAFTAADAQQVQAALFSSSFSAATPTLPSAAEASLFVQAIADSHSLADSLHDKPRQQSLLLASLAWREATALAPQTLGACAQSFALLLSLRYRHADSFQLLLEALSGQSSAPLQTWLSAARIAEVEPLLRAGATVVQKLAQPLLSTAPQPGKAVETGTLQNAFTWFGNALLLLPLIHQLPLQGASEWADLKQQPAPALLGWLVLCVCQGTDRFYSATQDSLLRDFCGIGPGVSLTEVASWLNEQFTEEHVAQLCAQLSAYLQQEAATNKPTLHCVQWQQDGKQVRVYGETRKGRWINLVVDGEANALAAIPQSADEEQLTLASADFVALWPGERLAFNESSRAGLTLLAQFTLKSFAYRLPGFANCSLAYLLRNFLCMSATLVAGEQDIKAFLSRVPMNVILNMAGITRGSLQLPGFDPRTLHLLQAD